MIMNEILMNKRNKSSPASGDSARISEKEEPAMSEIKNPVYDSFVLPEDPPCRNSGEERITLLTTKEVAAILHCSTHHVGDLRKYGLLRGTRFAKAWLFDKEDVYDFIENSLGKDYSNFKDMTPDAIRQKYGEHSDEDSDVTNKN